VTEEHEHLLAQLGFRYGINGPHAARTMMLDDLRVLLAHTEPGASRNDYAAAIVDRNVLGKSTKSARQLALRHLSTLYGLDNSNVIFRVLRRLWTLDEAAQPQLALAVALARDPLLRATQDFFLAYPQGAVVAREEVESFLSRQFQERFTAASLKSFAQNVSGTWTAAGVLVGHRRKIRSNPPVRPETAAMLLLLGYLEGRTGQRLFSSRWMSLLGASPDELVALANSASHRGLLVFMNAGGVREVRFPGYLSNEEEKLRQEASHVI
jgi:hypothetical protein